MGPLGDGAKRLPTADVAALVDEQSDQPGTHKGTVQAAP